MSSGWQRTKKKKKLYPEAKPIKNNKKQFTKLCDIGMEEKS